MIITEIKKKISIDGYLEKVARFCGDEYGQMVREQFKDHAGSSELGLLVSPSFKELEELKRAVAIMTPSEKAKVEDMTDEQIETIAAEAKVDPANLAIFMNGYHLYCKRVS